MPMNWMASLIIALVLVPSPEPGVTHPPAPTPTLPAIVALSIGDSLTVGIDGSATASYRGELSRLMRFTGQPYTWQVAAAGGSKCSYWAARIAGLIDTYHPSVIFLNCGTNDTPTDNTRADYETMLSVATSRGVRVIASLIGIPDMRSTINRARPYIIDWMHGTNEAIKLALTGFPSTPVANLERIPAHPEFLQTDGIHWTQRAEAAVGQKFYQAAIPVMGWKALSQMGLYEMCGLSGAWPSDPWPIPDVDYRVCRA